MNPFNAFEREREAKRRPGKAMSRAEERSLLAAARGGDRRAMSRLLTAVADPALRFGRSFCRHAEDAEDVMQDVLTSLARGLRGFRGESALSTWAYKVARNACLRRRRPRPALEPLERADTREDLAPAETESDPQRRYERRELSERIDRAIRALPPPQREVLILRDVEGLKAAEVGRALGVSERAVKSRLHRARLALRASLAPALGRSAEGGERSRAVAVRRRCPDTARLISRYLEGELGSAACATLERHVRSCGDCGAVCETLRAALAACREHGERPLPDDLRDRIRRTLRSFDDSRTAR